MLDFPTAEDHRALDLVAGLEEANSLPDPYLVVVGINFVTHLDLLDLGLVRLFLGLLGLFLLFELVFAVIHDPADRWIGFFAHQNQVELAIAGHVKSGLTRDDSQLAPVGIHHPEVGITDAVVDVGQLPHGSAAIKTGTGRHSQGRVNLHPKPCCAS